MVTATRRCATCGVEFTWTRRRTPDRRFCSLNCRALWKQAHGAHITPAPSPAVPGSAPAEDISATPLPPLGTGHSCPHCGHRLTVINFLLDDDESAADVDPACGRDAVDLHRASAQPWETPPAASRPTG